MIEIAPPYVPAALTCDRQASDPHALPLEGHISEVARLLDHPPANGEILVDRVNIHRRAEAEQRYEERFTTINGG